VALRGEPALSNPDEESSAGPDAGLGLLDAIPEGVVVVDDDERISFANRRAAEMAGFAVDELVGLPLDALIAGGIDGRTANAPSGRLLRRAEGTDTPVEVRTGASEATPGLRVVTLRGADDLHAEIQAKLEAEARLRAVVEQISAITYTWTWHDGQYFVVYTSPQIERILGYTPEEWIADPTAWYDWVHPEDRAAVIEENKRCETTAEAYSMQYRMLRKDGRIVWVEDSWVVVDEHDDRRVFQGVVFDITERKLADEEIAFLAHHDKLTGLPNRVFFEQALQLSIARARRNGMGVSVLFLDLDDFKRVNDSLGHHAGDHLLVELADRLRTCTRETDLVARQGGDEFLMLLSDLQPDPPAPRSDETTANAPKAVAERIRQALQEPFDLNGTQVRVSGSIGISFFPRDGLDTETLLKNADAAMYQAKRFVPGGHVLFASDRQPPSKLTMGMRLRRAAEEQHWVLHYQPIVDLSDGRMKGVEALIRWQEPNGGLVPPGEFVPLAEELGLIEAIGEWVIEHSSRQQRAWADQGLELSMSFNLSPRQLWFEHLAERVLARLTASGVDPHTMIAEVDESTAMADPEHTQKILAELHSLGLSIAIDDFGTGYSSLARLKHMPVDILKIDRAYVRDVDKDHGLAVMVRAMIELARTLNMTPLAVGVETRGEYVFLRSNGCRLAQGFYFGRPVPADAIPSLAAREAGLIPSEPADAGWVS
jgi:diguanylate cyclase (GGDEF)-like protein/PAS domain S-box-containing protein